MLLGVPTVWREPTNHFNDCCFCLTNTEGFSKKQKHKIQYPTMPSALKPVPHGEGLTVPNQPLNWDGINISDDDEQLTEIPPGTSDAVYSLETSASRLQEWNLLAKGTRVSVFRRRSETSSAFYRMQDSLCLCADINGLMNELGIELLIDYSKYSLKAVLLHNGNNKPSTPGAHSVSMKETYESKVVILNAMNCEGYGRQVCGDLRVTAVLLGLQGGFTKYCCCLCLWDSRATEQHLIRKERPQRTSFEPATSNVKHAPLVDPNNVLLPPFHIKPGLMKYSVKSMVKDGEGFKHLSEMFPQAFVTAF
ncbi:hypothetical protein Cfor_07168 [Coptotermes formosanus]|uniref:Uncharacterized protein n=1 Tax=Coptotermes formosanus TaxID=36987 RepID=A0A6L2PY41_COPFO|nr:hypothetical protein Cfor_07168 [Coptotermes formosanus]